MAQQTLLDSIKQKSIIHSVDTDIELERRDAVQYIDNSKILATQTAEDTLRNLYNNKRILQAKHLLTSDAKYVKGLHFLDTMIKLAWTVNRNALKHTAEDTFTKALIIPTMDGVTEAPNVDHTKFINNKNTTIDEHDSMWDVRAQKIGTKEAHYNQQQTKLDNIKNKNYG
jgi:hypothetical protein